MKNDSSSEDSVSFPAGDQHDSNKVSSWVGSLIQNLRTDCDQRPCKLELDDLHNKHRVLLNAIIRVILRRMKNDDDDLKGSSLPLLMKQSTDDRDDNAEPDFFDGSTKANLASLKGKFIHRDTKLNAHAPYNEDCLMGDQLKLLKGRADSVRSLASSPDGKQSSDDKSVQVWDASMGNKLKFLNGRVYSVRSVAFSPDGKQIVSGSDDFSVRVWDASTGEMLVLKDCTNSVSSVAFSPDGKQVVFGSNDKSVQVWDASTGDQLKLLKGHTDWVRSVAFSPNGKHIVSGSNDKSVRVWDASTGDQLQVLNGHTDWVRSIAFSPHSKQIVSGSNDKSVRIWDASTGYQLELLKGHTDWVRSVAFSPNCKDIVSGSNDKSVRVWDASTGGGLMVLKGHTDCVSSVAFSPNGKHIVSGSNDKSVRVWDASTGYQLKVVKGHTDWVRSVAFSPNCKQIVSGSDDSFIRVWDLGSLYIRKTISDSNHHEKHTGRLLSPDGQHPLMFDWDNIKPHEYYAADEASEADSISLKGKFVRRNSKLHNKVPPNDMQAPATAFRPAPCELCLNPLILCAFHPATVPYYKGYPMSDTALPEPTSQPPEQEHSTSPPSLPQAAISPSHVDGPQRKGRKFPQQTTDYLKAWFYRRIDHPYPSDHEKTQLCRETGLSRTQLSGWMVAVSPKKCLLL